jgi:hypothetical protein
MIGKTLDGLVRGLEHHSLVRKSDLHPGDRILIRTARSEYRLRVVGDGLYSVNGGWFDKKDLGTVTIGITGATWGGSAIMPQVLAACGMRVEFKNRLVTSPVRTIVVWPAARQN